MREPLIVAILGAQLTIGGSIVFHASEVRADTDDFGIVMIFFGVALGVLAAYRAYREDRSVPRT